MVFGAFSLFHVSLYGWLQFLPGCKGNFLKQIFHLDLGNIVRTFRSPRLEPRESPFLSSSTSSSLIDSWVLVPGCLSWDPFRTDNHMEVEGIGCSINNVLSEYFTWLDYSMAKFYGSRLNYYISMMSPTNGLETILLHAVLLIGWLWALTSFLLFS